MTMRERIEVGKLFTDECEGLPKERTKCKKHMNEFNASSPTNLPARYLAMTKLFGKVTKAWIEPPFYCCYGTNITIGDMSYINFNCNFVDDGKIIIGENSVIGAGSVVVHDIPANSVAAGNPCKVIREINDNDKKYYYKDRPITEEMKLRKNK